MAREIANWLTRKDAATYLEKLGHAISPRRLEKMASNNNAGKGPAFHKEDWSHVRYKREDLDAWSARTLVRIE